MTPPRVLLVGASGLLGQAVTCEGNSRSWNLATPAHVELDIALERDIAKLGKREYGDFDTVINCAGFTDVEAAEDRLTEALTLNGVAAGGLAALCAEKKWRLVHISTDFVFSGETDRPYVETDPTGPINAYGKSKLFGEQQVMAHCPEAVVVRTSWLYGASGKCFPQTILERWAAGQEIRVVNDQTGCPTHTTALAKVVSAVVEARLAGGVYHAAGPEAVTWHSFAQSILIAAAANAGEEPPVVIPVPSSAWQAKAKRPRNSALDCQKLIANGIAPMPSLKESIGAYLAERG